MEHLAVSGRVLGLFAVQDRHHGASLLRRRPPVDDRLHLALALIDGAGPVALDNAVQPVQSHLAEVPAIDADDLDAAAIAVGRPRFERQGQA